MERSDIFISYRRADVEFAKKFYHGLKETGRNIWVDWENLPPGVEGFSDEIQRGIESSDAFICILSPSYLESEYCLMELREALKLKKRVIPVVFKKFEPMPAPEGIGHINWVYFTPHAGQKNKFEDSILKVTQALEADYEHAREHTRLLLRAIDWQKNQQGKSYLLKDAEIDKAERWQVSGIGKNPAPNELQGEYILTSRTHHRQQQRRLMAGIGILLAFAVFAAIVAGFQWQASVRSEKTAIAAKNDALTQKAIADNQRATAVAAESTAVAAKNEADTQRGIAEEQAQNALISGLAAQSRLTQSRQLGILLALESYRTSLKKGTIRPSVQTSLRESLVGFSGIPMQTYSSIAGLALFSPDDHWLVGVSDDGDVQVSDLSKGLNVQPVTLMSKDSRLSLVRDSYTSDLEIAFSPDSQWLGVIYYDSDAQKSGVRVWALNDLEAGSQTLDLPANVGLPISMAFSSAQSKQPLLAVGLNDGSIYTWNVADLPDGQPTLFSKKDKFGRGAIPIVFSPEGNWLAVAFQGPSTISSFSNSNPSAGPSMSVWNVKNQVTEPIVIDLLGSPITHLTFSDKGKWLGGFSTSQSDGLNKLRLWNMSTLTKNATSANSLDSDTGGGLIAFSSDERWVASVGGISAEVWSLNSFSRIKLPGYKDSILTVRFSPDSQWLATGDYDGQVRFWKTADFAGKTLVEAQARTYNSFDVIVTSLDFNSDGSRLVAAGDQQVRLWNFPVPLSAPIKSPYAVDYRVFGNFILVQDTPDSVYVMDLSGDEPSVVMQTTQKGPLSYFTSTDKRYLVVTSAKQIQLWDMQHPEKPLFENTLDNGQYLSPSFTNDDRWFVYVVYGQIFALDLQNPGEPVILSGNRTGVPLTGLYQIDHWLISQSSVEILAWDTAKGLSDAVKLSNVAGAYVAQIPDAKPKWFSIQRTDSFDLWNAEKLSEAPLVFNGSVSGLYLDSWLLTSALDGTVKLWALSKPDAPIAEFFSYGVSESQNTFYYFDDKNMLWLLDLRSPDSTPVKVGTFDQGQSPIFSADDRWMTILSNDGQVTLLYDLTDGLSKAELPDVVHFNFSSGSRWLALQTVENNMALYDLQTHKQLDVKYPNSYGFQQSSPDGRWAIGGLSSNANTDMLLIDLNDPEKYYVLTGHTDQVAGKLFTSDGRWLLTYGWDGTIRIWNLENPADEPVVLSHENLVLSTQLSKNDKWLISATEKSVYVWQWDFNAVHDLACRLVGRNLTHNEWNKYIGGEYQKTCEQWP
ncbi:MAG: TIR domain-containing protein [Anaerolineales bacterium]|nr:TIR domain-containing protein [Anaerolineales bacterium]